MQPKPNGWPADAVVEDVPEVRARFRSSAWPPARDGLPAGSTIVGEWSVNRNLTGGGLPGQARGASGGSIAQGSFEFPQPAGAHLSPFTPDALAVQAGGLVDLTAWQGAASLPLGSFQSQTISGASTDGVVDVDIEEATQRLKRPFTYKWEYNPLAPTMDAAHVLEAAASQGGYTGNRARLSPSNPMVLLDADLNGRAITRAGGVLSVGLSPVWGSADGRVGLVSGMVTMTPSGNLTSPGYETANSVITFFLEAGGAGGVVEVAQANGADGLRFGFDKGTGRLVIRRMGNSTTLASYPVPWTKPVHSFMLRVVRPASSDPQVTVQLCRDEESSWTTLGTFTAAGLYRWTRQDAYHVGWFTVTHLRQAVNGWVRSFQAYMSVANAAELAALPQGAVTARIQHTGSVLSGVFDLSDKTCWEVIQDAARSTMGGAWMDETGTVVYRNRESLRSGTPVETVVSEERLDTLAWETSVEDVADRVELSYTPSDVQVSSQAKITLFEAKEPYFVSRNNSIRVVVEVKGTTNNIAGFLPIWDTTTAGDDGTRMSRWAASTSRDAGGERPASNAITIRATLEGPSRVSLRITNRTDQDLWMVDGNGKPCLIVRSTILIAPGDAQSMASGVAENRSITAFSFDAGTWVQDPATAQEMLDWLTNQTATAEPVIPNVGVKPDLARQLGDIVVVTDEMTQLRSKALITATSLSGNNAGHAQQLTMALLAETFRSFDAYCAAKGISTFDQLDAKLTTDGVATFDQFDAWCRINLVAY